MLRAESGLFFANGDHIRTVIQNTAADGTSGIVIDCGTMPFIDVTAARMLGDLTARLHQHGMRLVVASEAGQVRDVLAAVGGPVAHLEYFAAVQEAADSICAGSATGNTSTTRNR